MKEFDVAVIGAGLLGCFAARALAGYKLKVVLLEKAEDVCSGISKANTAIVYAGYDTKPQTLKTKMCLHANAGFEQLCQELDVRFCRCGSLMVCWGERGAEVLRQKYRQGRINGVPGLRLLSRGQVLALEPQLSPDVYLGLFAPGSGTVNPFELAIAAYENALANGCRVFFSQQVQRIDKEQGSYLLYSGQRAFRARAIINCAGLFADSIQELVSPPTIRLEPQKADYYLLDNKVQGLIRHIIFHEPEDGGKGLTLVPTVDGNLLIGPSEQQAEGKEDYATSSQGLEFLQYWCGKVVPQLPLEQIIRNFASLRPNPYVVAANGEGGYQLLRDKSISSFGLTRPAGCPRFISLMGIKTPGLTCAEELGRYAADSIAAELGGEPRADFDPCRQAIPRLAKLDFAARQRLIKGNPAYGRIVCRCRSVSEGEIVEAIHRGGSSINGVKRRVGAGMGRCQGSYCLQRVAELIAREKSLPLSAVTLEGKGSEIFGGGQHG
jgi:glycerol-3-phosphate dehydrogenase